MSRTTKNCGRISQMTSPRPVQETDKAVIDVEAQDDGIMGKILVCILPTTVISCIPTRTLDRFRTGRRTFRLGRPSLF